MLMYLVDSVVMADSDEEKKLLVSTSNENEDESALEDEEIVLSVTSEKTKGTVVYHNNYQL